MGARRMFTREFKLEAVRLVSERRATFWKRHRLLWQGSDVRFAFIAKNRGIWQTRLMCLITSSASTMFVVAAQRSATTTQ